MALTISDLETPGAGSWHDDANCSGIDVDLFFSVDEQDQRRALELCKACPVREACLRWAIEHRQMYGIWGGMKESKRRSIIRERRHEERKRRKRKKKQEAA